MRHNPELDKLVYERIYQQGMWKDIVHTYPKKICNQTGTPFACKPWEGFLPMSANKEPLPYIGFLLADGVLCVLASSTTIQAPPKPYTIKQHLPDDIGTFKLTFSSKDYTRPGDPTTVNLITTTGSLDVEWKNINASPERWSYPNEGSHTLLACLSPFFDHMEPLT